MFAHSFYPRKIPTSPSLGIQIILESGELATYTSNVLIGDI